MPCMNFATCVDMVNGYRCDCAPGFEGTTCDIILMNVNPTHVKMVLLVLMALRYTFASVPLDLQV
ncbi:Neurogenic locus notch-like protein 2 [Holothuria leucospilota]|uniref:Neurogenic locus notch-like protein 2 n=1 Tax=Holothuria leucospilota TaxID=206669 RepID=A0A9Q1BA44_HOLLE|nr:Neurogenic locus notch-like protein 2 [Holothuria leucospilota]